MSPIASARVEAICMLCFNLQSMLQLVSIPEDEHVSMPFSRNNTHLTERLQIRKGQDSYAAMREKGNVCICARLYPFSESQVRNKCLELNMRGFTY